MVNQLFIIYISCIIDHDPRKLQILNESNADKKWRAKFSVLAPWIYLVKMKFHIFNDAICSKKKAPPIREMLDEFSLIFPSRENTFCTFIYFAQMRARENWKREKRENMNENFHDKGNTVFLADRLSVEYAGDAGLFRCTDFKNVEIKNVLPFMQEI